MDGYGALRFCSPTTVSYAGSSLTILAEQAMVGTPLTAGYIPHDCWRPGLEIPWARWSAAGLKLNTAAGPHTCG